MTAETTKRRCLLFALNSLGDEFEAIARALSALGLERLAPPQGIMNELSARCTQLAVEFWQQFSGECQKMDWSLHGTTSRRLLCRAIFVELNDAFLLQNENLRAFFDKTSEATQRE